MSHMTGIVGAVCIGVFIGLGVHSVTLEIMPSFLFGCAGFLFTLLLFAGLVYIEDEIRGNKK